MWNTAYIAAASSGPAAGPRTALTPLSATCPPLAAAATARPFRRVILLQLQSHRSESREGQVVGPHCGGILSDVLEVRHVHGTRIVYRDEAVR